MQTKQKNEACTRMVKLGLDNKDFNLMSEFFDKNKVFVSSPGLGNRVGIVDKLTDSEKKLLTEFEEKYNTMVYHVIRNHTEFGVIYSFLYVSETEEEWEYDREDLTPSNGTFYPFAYCYNVGAHLDNTTDMEGFGEFGSIGIRYGAGGLVRVE